jgi:Ca2+-binding EF-hand superfamily protein
VDVSRLTTLFNRIDVSGDGLVSVDELKAAAAFAGIELTPEQIQQFEKAAGEGVDIDGFIAAAGQLLSGLSK